MLRLTPKAEEHLGEFVKLFRQALWHATRDAHREAKWHGDRAHLAFTRFVLELAKSAQAEAKELLNGSLH